jgi:hypothetical protein
MIGEYERTMHVEDGNEAGWYLLWNWHNTEADDAEFIYDSNSIQLFTVNGDEIAYGTYEIEFS